MLAWVFAIITVLVGIVPLLIKRRFVGAIVAGVISFFASTLLYYLSVPSLVWPLLGGVGSFIIVLWVISAVIISAQDERLSITFLFPICGALVYLFVLMSGWDLFRSADYAKLIGNFEKRTWTQDVQPKDPRHVRLVPRELAFYLASKQLGEAPGTIGSQFQISKDNLTLQRIKGELWYVAPLDFKSFSTWTSTEGSPGYVMVHGEDPKRQVVVKIDQKFHYMPGAFFSQNLERHLWYKYPTKGLMDYSFEIDEDGKAWWVVTIFKPAITWFGKIIEGVTIVDPENGNETFYALGNVPNWVDRVIPHGVIKNWVSYYGSYSNGWWNLVWANKDLFEPEEPSIVYGSDNEPYWVTSVTSPNEKDESMVGLFYTNSRTGKTVYYKASGGTDNAILDLVNNKVSYRKLHGDSPVLYNIYGTMTSIVPLLGESHTFQGVAMVDVKNMRMVEGDEIEVVMHMYDRLLATSSQQVAPEKQYDISKLKGVVDRFGAETKGGETLYYLHIEGTPHIFVGPSEMSGKLRVTKIGDNVAVSFRASDESTVPLTAFENLSLQLEQSADEKDIKTRVVERQEETAIQKDVHDARATIKDMNDKEVLELLKLKKN